MNTFKKAFLTLLVAILGFGAASAQIRFGVKAGLNLNSVHFNKDWKQNFSKDNQCGFTVGPMMEFQVPVIGLAFDVSAMYTRMNSELTDKDKEMGMAKNFIELPINVKYKFSLPIVGEYLAPYLFTGPSFAFRLDKNKKIDENLDIPFINTKSTQIAWNIGIGFQIVKHLQIQGSYGFGCNNIVKHVINNAIGADVNTADMKLKNNYWTITAAYLF